MTAATAGVATEHPPRHPRFVLADGVRGLACVAMVLIHVAVFTLPLGDSILDRGLVRLDVAFTVFFVLSAFLLYRPMIAHRTGGGRPPTVGGYAIRRFLRIYPAYWVAITVLALYPGLDAVLDDRWPGAYSLLGNINPPYATGACDRDVFRCGLPQTWSLTVEVTFYAVLPLFAWLTNRIARGRETRAWVPREIALIAMLGLVSTVLSMEPLNLRDEYWFRYTLLGNMLWIGLGLALAVASVAWHRAPRPSALQWLVDRPGLCWATAAVLWVALLFFLPAAPYIVADDTDLEFLVTNVVFGLVGVLVMIPVVFVGDGLGMPRRILALGPVGWYGTVAFGVFMWHVTIAHFLAGGPGDDEFWVTLALTFLISTPLASASYYAIERPLMASRSVVPARWR